MPSLTNPNNVPIVTGRPLSAHDIRGNYFIDPASGAEILMNDPAFLRIGTILAAFAASGVTAAAVTAKNKLLVLLGHGLEDICCSAENAASSYLEFPPEAEGRKGSSYGPQPDCCNAGVQTPLP